MIIDSHSHLADNKLINSTEEIIKRANEIGVTKIVSIGCSLSEAKKSIDIAKRNKSVFATVGLYPHDNGDENERELSLDDRLLQVNELVSHNLWKNKADNTRLVVAIGECGLDFTTPPPSEIKRHKKDQEYLFRKQIDIARNFELPVIIHSREATKETIAVLRDEMDKGMFKAVWHCYTENLETAKVLLELGVFISFTGILTYKNAEEIRKVAKFYPANMIMIETDAPYLVPFYKRKKGNKINEPAFVVEILEKLADIKKMNKGALEKVIYENTTKFYDIPA